MSDTIDPTTVTNSAITVKQGSTSISGRSRWPVTA